MKKVRRPRNFNLGDQRKHQLAVGEAGQKILYLKPDETTYLWIGAKKLRGLMRWLERAERWRNQ